MTGSRPFLQRLSRLPRQWRANTRASAAVEFAIIAPILGMIFATAIDLGSVVFMKFRIENAVSAGANYAMVNAAKVTSTNGATLAANISAIVGSNDSSLTSASVIVNNGPASTYNAGTTTPSGTAANADSCYCPTLASGSWSWGGATSCGTSCAAGGTAGKFIAISATRSYTPFFSDYGIVDGGVISVKVMVKAQ
jgi:Flp pilus assembly protein TadG